MKPKTLETWLRELPEPYGIRCDGAGSLVLLSKAVKRFHVAAEAIRDRDATHLEAVDKDGNVLRTFRVQEQAEQQAQASAVNDERETFRLFARELSAAYKQGAADHAAAYKDSHAQLVAVTNAVIQRLGSLERMLAQMMRDAHDRAEEAREEAEEAAETAAANSGEVGEVLKTIGPMLPTLLSKRPAPPKAGGA